MTKRTQEESGEERVTAKSRPKMSLIARAPSTLSSSALESPGKKKLWKSESLECESWEIASYSGWDDDQAWSSQEWKSDGLMDDRTVKPVVCPQRGAHAFQSRFSREHKHVILEEEENHDRTVKPVVCPQRGARAQKFIIGDDETELDLSLAISNECYRRPSIKHLYSWRRITQKIGIPSRTQKISQWNKCSTYLRNWCPNKMGSMKWKQLIGKFLHGSICLWLMMNKSSVFSAQRSTSIRILYCVLVRYTRTPKQTVHVKTDGDGLNLLRNTETLTESTASHWNSSGIFSQDSIRCSSVKKFKSYCWVWMKDQRISQEGSSSCRCSTTSHGDQKTTS